MHTFCFYINALYSKQKIQIISVKLNNLLTSKLENFYNLKNRFLLQTNTFKTITSLNICTQIRES